MPPRNAVQTANANPDTDRDAPAAVDTTALAAGAAEAGGIRPIDLPRGVRNPSGSRASERGVYLDRDGDRRIVGAGDVIPDGWTLVDDGDLLARADGTPTARDTADAAAPAGADAQALEDAQADAEAAEARAADLERQLAEETAAREAAEKKAADAEAAVKAAKK